MLPINRLNMRVKDLKTIKLELNDLSDRIRLKEKCIELGVWGRFKEFDLQRTIWCTFLSIHGNVKLVRFRNKWSYSKYKAKEITIDDFMKVKDNSVTHNALNKLARKYL